jgi:2-hydroxy-3-oxopropionate reductase
VGAGNVTKLANQIMVASNLAGMSEALVLATRYGLDPEMVYQAVKGGLAGSAVLDAKAPMVMARDFRPGGRIALHSKDLRNALRAAEALDVPLLFTSLAAHVMTALVLVAFTEQLAGVEVRRGIPST